METDQIRNADYFNSRFKFGAVEKSATTATHRRHFPEANESDTTFRKYRTLRLLENSSFKILVTCVVNPFEFYAQPLFNQAQLFKLSNELNKYYEQPKNQNPQLEIDCGRPCAVHLTTNGLWYRGEVMTICERKVKVKLVDYGKTQLVPRENVAPLPPQFLLLPRQGIKMALSTSRNGLRVESLDDKFREDVFYKRFLSEIVDCPSGRDALYTVRLSDIFGLTDSSVWWKTFANVSKPFVEKSAVEVGDKLKVVVTTVVSKIHFYCQIPTKAFQSTLLCFGNYYSRELESMDLDAGQLSPNTFCAAWSPEDEIWFRARVVHVSGNHVTVFNVDTGCFSAIPHEDCQFLLQEFAAFPRQAILCQLKHADVSSGHLQLEAGTELLTEFTAFNDGVYEVDVHYYVK